MLKNKLMLYDYISRGGTPEFKRVNWCDIVNIYTTDIKIRNKNGILPKFNPEFVFKNELELPF